MEHFLNTCKKFNLELQRFSARWDAISSEFTFKGYTEIRNREIIPDMNSSGFEGKSERNWIQNAYNLSVETNHSLVRFWFKS